MKEIKGVNIPACAVLICAFVVFTGLYALTPWQFDDYAFARVYLDINGGESAFSGHSFAKFIGEIRQYDNSRLSNVLAPLMLLVEPWCTLRPLISGLMTVLMIWLVSKFICPRGANALKISLIWASLMVVLPWRNNLLVADYTLNYVYAAVVELGFVWTAMEMGRGFGGKWSVLLFLLLALPAAVWHEGFAGPVAAGLFVFGILNCRRHRRLFWCVWTVFVLAMFANALSPGMLERIHREGGQGLMHSLPRIVINQWLWFVALACGLVLCCLRRSRAFLVRSLRDSFVSTFSVIAFSAGALTLCVDETARVAFWPQLTSLIVVGRILSLNFKAQLPLRRTGIIAAALTAALFLQGAHTAWWQFKFLKQHNEIVSIIESRQPSDSHTVFYDVITPESVPASTLLIPNRTEFLEPFGQHCIEAYYGDTLLTVVPAKLNCDVLSRGRRINSNLLELEGYLVCDSLSIFKDIYDEVLVSATMSDGSIQTSRYGWFPFYDCTGKRLLYMVQLKRRWVHKAIDASNIQEATIIKIIK